MDSGASHAEQERFELSSTGNYQSVQKPYERHHDQWEVQINEGAMLYVKDGDLFVTIQLLEDISLVVSLRHLCGDHWLCDGLKVRNQILYERPEDILQYR